MIDYPQYEKAVIVTWDGDIACLVEYLNKHNKLETLIVPNERRYSEFLRIVAKEKIVFLAKLGPKMRYRNYARKKKTL
jgi:hypothetical protein